MVRYRAGISLKNIKNHVGKDFTSGKKAIEFAEKHEMNVYRRLKGDERGWHIWFKY